jgi:predicted nucleic acid-binding protein
MYLLDTDTVIYALKGHPNVVSNLKLHLQDPLLLSSITLMELFYGAYKSQKVTVNLAKIKTLEKELHTLPVTREIAEVFGMLKADIERKGTPLDDFDLALAASAMARNLVLVTNNIKHFKRIEGLRLENWAEPGEGDKTRRGAKGERR